MKTNITAKNMFISQAITDRILRKTAKMERYLNSNSEMQIRLEKKKNGIRSCEITIPVEGVILRAEASNDDNLYVSIDQALARLERQIHKHRTRLEKRLRETAFEPGILEYDAETAADLEADESKPQIVRHKTYTVRPMNVEDAILQMELLGHTFFVFLNAETNQTNVLYLRNDGNLGLMEPEA